MKRIGQMITGIREAAKGNYAVRLETSDHKDELDSLAEALNHLLDQVQDRLTACQETEAALRESQEDYRRLEANIPGMAYTYKFEAGERHVFPYVSEGCRELFGVEPADLIRDGSLLAGLIHPDDLERRDASIKQSMDTLQPWREELRHIVDGQVRWYDCMSRPERQPDGEILWNGIILEITERKRAEEKLNQNLREMTLLHEIGHLVSSSISLDQVGKSIIDGIAEALDPETVLIFLRENGNLRLLVEGPEDSRFKRDSTPDHLVGECLCGLAVRDGQALYSNDITTDPRCTWEECKKAGLQSFAALPLMSGDQILGVLGLASGSPRDFEKEAPLLETLAAEISLGLRNSLLLEEATTRADELAQEISERRRAEEALQESEELHRVILSNISDAVFITDGKGEFTYICPNADNIFGYSKTEIQAFGNIANLLGEGWFDPEELEKLGEIPNIEQDVLDREGRSHSLLINIKRVSIKSGTMLYTCRDITERKQSEEALQESEERLRLALKAANQGLYDLNVQTGEAQVTPEYATMLGYDPAEFHETNARWIARLHPDDRAGVSATYRAYAKGEIPDYAVEFRQRTKSGDWKWILSLGKIVAWDAEGRPLRMLGTHTDISERKRAEAELVKSLEILNEMGAIARIGGWEHDLITGEATWTEALYDIIEIESGGPIPGPQEHLDYYPPKDRAILADAIQRAIATGAPFDLELQGHTAKKRLFWARIKGRPVFQDGKCLRLVGTFQDITERKRAEEAVRESEERLRLALVAANQGLYDLNVQTGETQVTPEYATMLGYDPAEFHETNARWIARLHPDDRERVLATYLAYLRGEIPDYVVEFRQLTKSGDWKWILSLGNIVAWDDEGKPLRMLGTHTDITVRKRGEEELRKTTETLQALVQASPAAIIALEPDGIVTLWNPAAEQLLGWRADEAVGKFLPHIPKDKYEEHLALRERVLRGELTEFEVHRQRKDGSKVDLIISTAPLRNAQGEVTGIISVQVDVTERKRMEEELRESEARFRQVVEFSPLPIGIIKGDVPEYMNPEFVATFGYTLEDLPNMAAWFRLAYPDPAYRQSVLERWDRALKSITLEGGSTGPIEAEITCKDGSQRTIEVFGAKMGDKSLAVFNDLTERKRAEEALRESEVRFRQVVEFSPLPIGIIEGDVPEYVNPEFVATFGYTLEDLPNLAAWFRLAYPDPAYRQSIRERWQTALRKAVAENRATEGLEVKVTCKDGSVRDVQIWSVLVGSKIIAFCHDFTDRKRMEEALEKRLVALSRPLDEAGDLTFDDLFDLNDIQRLQDLFAEVTGVAALITTPDGTPITQPSNFCRLCSSFIRQTEQGRQKCSVSDAHLGRYSPEGPIIQHCLSAGLCGAGASITVGGKHVANWLVGQVRDGTESEESMRDYARTIGVDEEEFIVAFREVPIMAEDQFRLVAQAHFLLANQLSNLAYQNIQQARFITERQRAEEELRQNEKKYRSLYQEFQAILNAIPDGLSLISPDFRIVWGNEATTFGIFSVSETLGQHCFTLRHGRSEPCEDCPVLRCFRSGKLETQEVTSFGGIWELYAVPLYDDEGELRGAIEVARDITERKESEEAIKQSEAKYRRLYESMTDAFIQVDMAGHIQEANRAYLEMLGYSDEELRQLTYHDLTPEKWHALEEWIVTEQVLVQGFSGVYEKEYRQKDGTVFPAELRTYLLRDDAGQPIGMWAIVRDITERKRAEEALRLTQFAMDSSPDAVFWLQPDGSFLYVNEEACRSLEYSREELLSLSIFDIDRDLTPEKWFPHWQWAKEQERVLLETYQRTKKGRIFPVEVKADFVEYTGQEFFCTFVRDITERKQAEEALRESEERYRLLFQNANDGIFLLDPDTKHILDCNRKAAEITGYSVAELKQMNADQLHPPEELSLVDEAFRVVKAGHAFEGLPDMHYRRKDGRLVPIEASGTIFTLGDRQVKLSIIRDITERKRAEEEIRQYRDHLEKLVAERTAELSRAYESLVENEARYRLLAENITDVIWTMDFDLRFTYLSPSVQLLRGYTPQETMAQSLEEIFLPESFETIKQVLGEELLREREGTVDMARVREFELEMRRRDGSTIWVEVRASFVRDLNLRAVGLLGVARDISRRRRAEEALRESEARFRTIFSHAPLGIVLRDLDGRMLEANPAALKILGYSFEEICRAGLEFVHPEDFKRYQQFMETMERDHVDHGEVELRARRKDGTWAWGRLHISLVREPSGEAQYLLGMIEDISRLKQWEEDIRTYQERLRSLASELTLTEERERRRLATNVHDNIGQVLALTQIKLGSLADDAISPASQNEMREVRDLITQVIHTTRSLTFELGSPILYELGLEEAVESLAEHYENEYGLNIRVEREPLPEVLEDAASLLLFRALQELLTNVVKHADADNAWVSLKVRDDQLTLQVRDDGRGFHVKPNGSHWYRHLGFGLFSLRERLSQLGGELSVESQPGKGTTVWITLPLASQNKVTH